MGQIRSTIRPILAAVKAKLITDEVLGEDVTADRIRVVNRDPRQVPVTIGDKDILIRPRREQPAGRFDSGSGRIDRRAYRLVDITVRSRFRELDEMDQAAIALLDDELSHLLIEDLVIDSLDLEYLENDEEDLLLFEPMRWIGGPSDPDDLNPQKYPGWIFSTIQFELGYQRDLTQ